MTQTPPRPNIFAQMREARRGLAAADDQQILRVLRMVEAMENRGDADALLVAVRSRLSVLRPPRKMRFSRLLFIPADTLIVDPKKWDPSLPLLPRTALMCLTNLVRSLIGDMAREIDEMIANSDNSDEAMIAKAGAILWPAAAKALRAAAMPPDWPSCGLPQGSFGPIARGVSGMMLAATKLVTAGEGGPVLAEIVNDTRTNPAGFAMLVTGMLLRYPHDPAPRAALSQARNGPPQIQEAARRAVDAALLLLAPENTVGLKITHETSSILKRDIALLELLEADPQSARRANELRMELRQGCVTRFQATMNDCVLAPMAEFAQTGAAADQALFDIEQTARALRAFEVEARRLGGGDAYDKALLGAADTTRKSKVLNQVERARLVEIFSGPEAGYALLCA